MRAVTEVRQSAESAKEVQKVLRECEMGAMGYTPLFYNKKYDY